MNTSKRARRHSPGIDEEEPSADRYARRSQRPSRTDHTMRSDDTVPRGRYDVDDRWRMTDEPERYAYDRREERGRGGEPRDVREGDGWARRGHNDAGHLHVTRTALAATNDHHTKVAVAILAEKTTGKLIAKMGRSGIGRGIMGGSLASPLQPRMLGTTHLVSGLPAMVSPPIARNDLGNLPRRGNLLAEMAVQAQTNGTRTLTRTSRRTRARAARRAVATTFLMASKNAVGATTTTS
ncbi:hypothetical protein BD413DRAFT_58946 [Trametes elegans]|nr:hypothetical protein BD413DRAFT_58946 [Trametes elegans]